MLTLYREHNPDCPHKSKGRKYTKCQCVIWYDWATDPESGRRRRGTLQTRDWQAAVKASREMEMAGGILKDQRVPIEKACDAWMKDATARHLESSSIKKLRVLSDQLKAYSKDANLNFIHEFEPETVRSFRQTWADGAASAEKKFERLRSFFRFCLENEWIKKSPAANVKAPKPKHEKKHPFTPGEMARIYQACDDLPQLFGLKPLVLLLRYSGLRTDDAESIQRSDIDQDGVLRKLTTKGAVEVVVPLPPQVIEALDGLTPISSRYLFWTGIGTLDTLTGNWRRKFRKLFARAGFSGTDLHAHAHRFRHTFAVELLQSGASMEEVARLLGHQDIRVTQRHYASWSKKRQEQAEESVRRMWDTAAVPVPRKRAGAETPLKAGKVKTVKM